MHGCDSFAVRRLTGISLGPALIKLGIAERRVFLKGSARALSQLPRGERRTPREELRSGLKGDAPSPQPSPPKGGGELEFPAPSTPFSNPSPPLGGKPGRGGSPGPGT